jgi:hypothetical protein
MESSELAQQGPEQRPAVARERAAQALLRDVAGRHRLKIAQGEGEVIRMRPGAAADPYY